MEAAFSMFDQDGNGLIERKELEMIMGEVDAETWTDILADADTDKDGKVWFNY